MAICQKSTVSVCLMIVLSVTGCRSLRDDIGAKLTQAMSEEPDPSRSQSQWTTHSTSTQAVPSVGSPNHGDFGNYSQPTTGEKPYHAPRARAFTTD